MDEIFYPNSVNSNSIHSFLIVAGELNENSFLIYRLAENDIRFPFSV